MDVGFKAWTRHHRCQGEMAMPDFQLELEAYWNRVTLWPWFLEGSGLD